MTGRLAGVGVGPGDPELITVKARRLIEAADVVAYPVARHGRSVARGAAAPYLRDQIELPMTYPVTTEQTDHPGGYAGALRDFYDDCARRIADHLDAGRDVAVLCEGDPLFYGSYMYLHDRLAARYPSEVVAGVTAFSAAAAGAHVPLARRDDVLTVLPGTLPPDVLAARLRATDAAVVMKLGRNFDGVRAAVAQAGLTDRAIYVERASAPEQRIAPLAEVEGPVPYMSLVLVPAQTRSVAAGGLADSGVADAVAAGSAPVCARIGEAPGAAGPPAEPGEVVVVGLGPAGAEWLTPEARAELAGADELVGYETYLARVPVRRGQGRHASGNRVEADRARHALGLAAAGARVAVVSSGDPGIFAMAAVVLELACEFPAVAVRVLPGISAMQAAAARVGAPLGHDFCVISLSDNLKPWSILARRLHAAGVADLVLALYNPASRTRRDQLAATIDILRIYRPPSTPVVVARAVGADDETVVVTTLAAVDLDSVDMRTLLIVGSRAARALADGRVYTPRGYPE